VTAHGGAHPELSLPACVADAVEDHLVEEFGDALAVSLGPRVRGPDAELTVPQGDRCQVDRPPIEGVESSVDCQSYDDIFGQGEEVAFVEHLSCATRWILKSVLLQFLGSIHFYASPVFGRLLDSRRGGFLDDIGNGGWRIVPYFVIARRQE